MININTCEYQLEGFKKNSNYHFDTHVVDGPGSCVQHLGRIEPFWDHLLPDIIANASAGTWADKGMKNTPTEGELVLISFNRNIPPEFQALSDQFGLDQCQLRLHVQTLGQMWSLHIDDLTKFAPEDPDSVMRINIHLTDWQLGQHWEYGTYTHKHWRAGDVNTFDWKNIPHGTANIGFHPRVTFQLTGIKTAKTEEMLAQLATTK